MDNIGIFSNLKAFDNFSFRKEFLIFFFQSHQRFLFIEMKCQEMERNLSLVLLLISNLTNGLRLHQFLVTKSVEANKSVKTDANGAH